MSEEANNSKKEHDGPRKRRTLRQRPGLVGALLLVAIVVVVGGALWWRHSRHYEKTDDAYIDVPAERVSPRVAGRVRRVLVTDNQDVAAGQVLVELDPADLENRLAEARAGEAQARAQLANAEAQRGVIAAQLGQARAGEGVAAANATNAASELTRIRQLQASNTGAVTEEQVDRVTAQAASTKAQLQAAHNAVAVVQAQEINASRQIDAARAGLQSATAQAAQAELTRSYAQVKAGIAGRIARKTVAEGNYVTPGAELMAIVPREVYVTANFKETQLARMRPGQPVEVKVDAFPDLKLTGRVASVQPAAGQAFDVLPSQNVAGNWVKVVQRVPVKITLDRVPADPQRLGPGMSVEVTVNVTANPAAPARNQAAAE